MFNWSVAALSVLALVVGLGCEKSSKISMERAKAQVVLLEKTVSSDVAEVRSGLPEGAQHLQPLFKKPTLSPEDAQDARAALQRARDDVQDLRVAKSTFFAVATPDGIILRNDRDQDLMAGKNLFASFPALKSALDGRHVETRGSMPEAAGVRDAPDGQWVAAEPVKVDGTTKGLYVTGWSWSAYAYRLENAARTSVRGELKDQEKMPLLYVYVLVDKQVFGAPVSPRVNAESIARLSPMAHTAPGKPFGAELSITDRDFGLAVALVPALGEGVAVAVLRSET
jgi:hypothetical protein